MQMQAGAFNQVGRQAHACMWMWLWCTLAQQQQLKQEEEALQTGVHYCSSSEIALHAGSRPAGRRKQQAAWKAAAAQHAAARAGGDACSKQPWPWPWVGVATSRPGHHGQPGT
ncbi:hypothetical protein DAI22_01g258550 [Oryza sativa Japonica Group]|nr:hypothetical protein DAI22_01g258550 [Oryza sativa Japonica Group]